MERSLSLCSRHSPSISVLCWVLSAWLMVQLKALFYIPVQTQSQAGPIWLPGENILIFLFLLPMAANCLISVADIFLRNNSPSDYTRRQTDAPFLLSLDYLSIFL